MVYFRVILIYKYGSWDRVSAIPPSICHTLSAQWGRRLCPTSLYPQANKYEVDYKAPLQHPISIVALQHLAVDTSLDWCFFH